jgi:hypothetical protein
VVAGVSVSESKAGSAMRANVPPKPKVNAIAAMRQIIVVSVKRSPKVLSETRARKDSNLLILKRRFVQKLLAKGVLKPLAMNLITLAAG